MGRKLIRLGLQLWGPTGKIPLGRTAFRDRFIATGRLKLVPLGARAVAVVEDEVDELIEELIAARETTPPIAQALPAVCAKKPWASQCQRTRAQCVATAKGRGWSLNISQQHCAKYFR